MIWVIQDFMALGSVPKLGIFTTVISVNSFMCVPGVL